MGMLSQKIKEGLKKKGKRIITDLKPLPNRTLTGKRKTPKDPTRTVKAEKVQTVQPTKNVSTVKPGQVRTAKKTPLKEGETVVGTVQGSVIPGKGRKYPGRGRIRKTAKPGIVSAIEKKVKKRNIRRGLTKAGVAGFVGSTIAIPLLDGKSSKYTIKEGDTLSEIAKRKGTTLGSLIKANPKLKNPNKIYTGKKLELSKPVKNRKSVYQDVSKKEMKKMSVKKKKAGGIVKKGMGKQILKGMKKFDPAMRVHKDAYIIGGIGTVGIGGGAALGHKDAVKKSKQKKEGRSRGIGGKDVSRKKKMSVKKKHGGRITYRMTGGQVVDAGYD